jgi:hypothetical protein
LSDFTKAENSSVFTRAENLSGFLKGENLSILPKAKDLSVFLKAEGVSDFEVWDIGQVTVSNFDCLPFTPPPLWSPSPVLQNLIGIIVPTWLKHERAARHQKSPEIAFWNGDHSNYVLEYLDRAKFLAFQQ